MTTFNLSLLFVIALVLAVAFMYIYKDKGKVLIIDRSPNDVLPESSEYTGIQDAQPVQVEVKYKKHKFDGGSGIYYLNRLFEPIGILGIEQLVDKLPTHFRMMTVPSAPTGIQVDMRWTKDILNAEAVLQNYALGVSLQKRFNCYERLAIAIYDKVNNQFNIQPNTGLHIEMINTIINDYCTVKFQDLHAAGFLINHLMGVCPNPMPLDKLEEFFTSIGY